jgi:hypothetical protein
LLQVRGACTWMRNGTRGRMMDPIVTRDSGESPRHPNCDGIKSVEGLYYSFASKGSSRLCRVFRAFFVLRTHGAWVLRERYVSVNCFHIFWGVTSAGGRMLTGSPDGGLQTVERAGAIQLIHAGAQSARKCSPQIPSNHIPFGGFGRTSAWRWLGALESAIIYGKFSQLPIILAYPVVSSPPTCAHRHACERTRRIRGPASCTQRNPARERSRCSQMLLLHPISRSTQRHATGRARCIRVPGTATVAGAAGAPRLLLRGRGRPSSAKARSQQWEGARSCLRPRGGRAAGQ